MLQFLEMTQADIPNCKVKVKYLLALISAFFMLPYSATTRSLSRFTPMSLRTIFRILKISTIPWVLLRITLFKRFAYVGDRIYIIAGDECVIEKSRYHSFGLSRFYSSTQKQTVQGICIFNLSLVDVVTRKAYPFVVKQVVNSEEDKKRIAADKEKRKKSAEPKEKKPVGRPKARTAEPKKETNNAAFRAFKGILMSIMSELNRLLPQLKPAALVLDNAYAAPHYIYFAESQNLQIITRFKSNGKFKFKFEGQQAARGAKKIYGNRVNTKKMPVKYLVGTETKDGFRYDYYQFEGYSENNFKKKLLNFVVVVATRLKDSKVTANIFMSTNLKFSYNEIMDYYSLRFQIEFDFRDAKSYFGLDGFKNYKEQNLTNFINLIFTVVLVGRLAQDYYRIKYNNPNIGIIDLKLMAQGQNIAQKIIKLVRKNPNIINNPNFFDEFKPDGLIHAA